MLGAPLEHSGSPAASGGLQGLRGLRGPLGASGASGACGGPLFVSVLRFFGKRPAGASGASWGLGGLGGASAGLGGLGGQDVGFGSGFRLFGLPTLLLPGRP